MILRKRNKKGRKVFFGVVIVIVAGLFVYGGLLRPVVYVASRPFIFIGEKSSDLVGVGKSLFSSERALIEENKILQERVNVLEGQIALGDRAEVFSEENLSTAKVLVRPSKNLYGTLLVRKTGEGEVSVGDAVLSREGSFIGLVDEITFSYIKVTLSSHPGFSQDLTVERSGIPITVVGRGAGNMKAELPQGADVEEFDVIVDLGSGRVVAEVGQVDADESSAFTTVYMRMPVNIFEITEVLIAPRLE